MGRGILAVALAFVATLLGLTVVAAVDGGVNVLTFVSAGVLAMLLFGIVGALRHPPEL
jgi:hypothetical protein